MLRAMSTKDEGSYIEIAQGRRLIASLPSRRRGFASGAVRVGLVADKLALGQIFVASSAVLTDVIMPP
jgi:hypothetical protein